MARFANKIFLVLPVFFLFISTILNAQIKSIEADYFTKVTNDTAYIFCTTKDRASIGTLTATTPMGVSSTFYWEKFDTITEVFTPFSGYIQFEDTLSSTISRLDDGLYRVTINSGGVVVPPYQAYVLNNWIEVTKADIPDSTSTCDGFQILSEYEYSPLRYFDPITNVFKSLHSPNPIFKFEWYRGTEFVRNILSPYIFPPIASETPIKYDLTVTDEFGCTGKGSVDYNSKVPKSGFEIDPMEGEAVLKVTFTDKSINYDSILWMFYKNDSIIKQEVADNKGLPIDSIDFVLLEKSPVYEYEWSGNYLIKLVTIKVNPTTGNCYDTMYMKKGEFINVENSLVEVPNVFTPGNNDGMNDEFVVKTKSLKSMSIHIYNRWGGLVHSWSYSNIRGRDYTYEHSVWDGKIGGRMASPGVYFYVIRAVGRDGKKQNKEGFVHLFRNKD